MPRTAAGQPRIPFPSPLSLLFAAMLCALLAAAPAQAKNQTMERGLAAINNGQYQLAIDLYTQAINSGELSENNLSISYNNRGVAHNRAGDDEAAIEDYSRAIQVNPRYFTALSNRAYLYYKSGRYSLASQDYTTCLDLQPGSPLMFFNRALCHKELNKLNQAMSDFSKAADLYEQAAFSDVNNGSPDSAATNFNDAALAQARLAEIKAGLGDRTGAAKAYQRSLELNPYDWPTQYQRILNLKALSPEDAALAMNNLPTPRNALDFETRAMLHDSLGDPESALVDRRKAFSLYLSGAAEDLQDEDDKSALEKLNKALELEPRDPDALALRGQAYYYLEQFDPARKDLDLAISLNPKNAGAYYFHANVLAATYQFPQAIQDLEQAMLLAPDETRAQNDLAWLLATCPDGTVRNGPRAVELALALVEATQNNDPFPLDTLAAAYAENNEFDKAIQAQTRCINLLRQKGQDPYPGSLQRLELYKNNTPYRD